MLYACIIWPAAGAAHGVLCVTPTDLRGNESEGELHTRAHLATSTPREIAILGARSRSRHATAHAIPPPILYTILFLPLDQMPPLISACSLDCSKGISLPPMGSSTGGIAHGCDQAWVGGIEHWQRARQHQTQQPHLRREAKCSMKNLASPPTTGTFSPVSVRRIHTTDVSSW